MIGRAAGGEEKEEETCLCSEKQGPNPERVGKYCPIQVAVAPFGLILGEIEGSGPNILFIHLPALCYATCDLKIVRKMEASVFLTRNSGNRNVYFYIYIYIYIYIPIWGPMLGLSDFKFFVQILRAVGWPRSKPFSEIYI